MNKLWKWLKKIIEVRPITFVIVGGLLSYFVGFTIFVASIFFGGFPRTTSPEITMLGVTGGSLIVVVFHWFVARYDRKSPAAQIFALIPAVFLFVFVTIGAGLLGVKYQSCTVDSVTGEIRACQESWQFVWEKN